MDLKKLEQKTLRVGGLEGSSLNYFIANHFERALVVYPHSTNLVEERRALEFFAGSESSVAHFPAFESIYDAVREDPRITFERLQLQCHLALGKRSPHFILTNEVALSQKTLKASALEKAMIHFKRSDFVDRDDFVIRLQAAGYVRDELADDHGTFSVRGLLIDIFPPNEKNPLRLEFFGDEVISIRAFDSETQRSLEEREELVIPPCRELILSGGRLLTFRKNLKDYGDARNIAREDRESILVQLENHRELVESRTLLPALGEDLVTLEDYLPKKLPIIFVNRNTGNDELDRFWISEDHDFSELQRLAYGPNELRQKWNWNDYQEQHEVSSLIDPVATNYQTASLSTLRPKILGSKSLEPLFQKIREAQEKDFGIHLVLNNTKRKEALQESLDTAGVETLTKVEWHSGPLFSGFESASLRKIYITERDVFGTKSSARSTGKRVSAKDYLREFSDLQNGDFVVHEEHGVGKFQGLVKLQIDVVVAEFALIEYADADKLYLPIYRLDQISRYVPGDGVAATKLDRLGSNVFLKKKQKAREDILKIAHELLEVAAKRKIGKIIRGPVDESKYQSFCNDFPFELTGDQESTVSDLESDLRKNISMDRLVCGDVGFGKTEVALRAAMFRVLQGAQVAILAPTTLLVEQHFKGFQKRFSPYGIKVERLSGFMTQREQKLTLERVASGETQVVVGTHRLLQNDVQFKNLGFLVVDEEQRFGVKHKERVKKLRANLDILTLSATPIPRTLQMAIVGIRDLSLITTPPETREAVNTYVGSFDKKLIRDACLRELQRSGQILFVHNRVQSIVKLGEELKKFLAEFRIAVGHGQMPDGELEKVMIDFLDHKYDMLLATSIIENGLDIPNANTIFVDHAEKFGLSDLYQIRGRVGRSHRKAYAYFLVHENTALTPDASKRLQVIQSCTELGSGFKVASHDLEIRGSGNLLGEAQSGVIAEVGLELYNEMLHECLAEIRSDNPTEPRPEFQSGYTAYIPESYIPEANVRIGTYRKLNQLASLQELLDFESELLDRFGLYPQEVEQLLQMTGLRCMAAKLKAKSLEVRPSRMVLEFRPETPLDPVKVIKEMGKKVSIDLKGRLVFQFSSAVVNEELLVGSEFKSPVQFDIHTCRAFLKKLAESAGVAILTA